MERQCVSVGLCFTQWFETKRRVVVLGVGCGMKAFLAQLSPFLSCKPRSFCLASLPFFSFPESFIPGFTSTYKLVNKANRNLFSCPKDNWQRTTAKPSYTAAQRDRTTTSGPKQSLAHSDPQAFLQHSWGSPASNGTKPYLGARKPNSDQLPLVPCSLPGYLIA